MSDLGWAGYMVALGILTVLLINRKDARRDKRGD